jgi:hypothetical protein
MNIAVYQTVNAHAPAIHWWLANDSRFGPQIYLGKEPFMNTFTTQESIGNIVAEMRNPGYEPITEELYEIHQESMRKMENLDAFDNVSDCTREYFEYSKTFEYPVWSNYFGNTKNKTSSPYCDKLIFAKSNKGEDPMFYITQYAYQSFTNVEDVKSHSEIWWKDHMFMDGNNVGTGGMTEKWKEIWYAKYEDQSIQDFHDGKLKYMWQLNQSHWDLYHSLLEDKENITLDYSEEKLLERCDDTQTLINQENRLTELRSDALVVNIDWYENPNIILDYLEVSNSPELTSAVALYKERFLKVREAYNKKFNASV